MTARLRAAGCVFSEEEAALLVAEATGDALWAMVERRESGEPLEHVLGWAEFCGLRIGVGPGVFVPRPRTEHLVGIAAGLVGPGSLVVELCCGSGAISAALMDRVPGLVVRAAELDAVAAEFARRNLGPDVAVHEGDLFDALPAELLGRIDLIVANAPYVPSSDLPFMPAEARDFEPRLALDGGDEGLGILRRIATGAHEWLAPGGRLVMESALPQARQLAQAVEAAGFESQVAESEPLDVASVVGTRQ